MTRTVIVDNEAVQALRSVEHPKHRRALSHVQVVATRKRKAIPIRVLVPAAVRVEAGWDRTAPEAAFINLLGITDAPLDRQAADAAAAILAEHGVSVADAHVGAIVRASSAVGPVTVVSSDPHDVRTVAGTVPITLVTL